MGRIRILSPVVEQYALTISVPMEQPKLVIKKESLQEAEADFIRKRDREDNYIKKLEFDRARAVVKYAEHCNASLSEMVYRDNKLYITLQFSNLEHLIHFQDTMGSTVASSTMI